MIAMELLMKDVPFLALRIGNAPAGQAAQAGNRPGHALISTAAEPQPASLQKAKAAEAVAAEAEEVAAAEALAPLKLRLGSAVIGLRALAESNPSYAMRQAPSSRRLTQGLAL